MCDCVIKPKVNGSNCEVERTCEKCLERISQKKTCSNDNNIIKKTFKNMSSNECFHGM